jgi:hypothetical protein
VTGDQIRIEGIREFQKALRGVDAGMPKLIRALFNEAGGLIVNYAQSHIEVRSGRARSSIKARSGQRTADVVIGGSRAPYTPWIDFGGEGKRRGRPAGRPFVREGRYVYRGLRVHNDDITQIMVRGLGGLAAAVGMEVS